MRVPTIAICTLAALSAIGFNPKAIAATPSDTAPQENASNVVVSAQPNVKPTAIAAPENPTNPQFSTSNKETTAATPKPTDLAVTATEVRVVGASPELEQIVRQTIRTRPGGDTSASQIQNDVKAILGTGLFANASVSNTANASGWQVVYRVEPVVVRSLKLEGAQVLTQEVANDIFKSQLGATVNPSGIRQNIEALNKWYADNGYVLAQVLDTQTTRDGTMRVVVAEGKINDIKVKFIDQDGKITEGRTKPDYLLGQLKLKPGQIFRIDTAKSDLQQLYQLGLFQVANISLEGDARKVDLTYEVSERSSRLLNGGGGYSDASGIFGTVSYQDQNFNGINQKLGINIKTNLRDLQFDGRFTNPYNAATDESGYSISAFRSGDVSPTFDGNVKLATGEQPREDRLGGGFTLSRPVGEWQGNAGVNYTRVSIRDRNGNIAATDQLGNPLSFSRTGIDDLLTVSAGLTRDSRNNAINPTEGSVVSFTSEQSLPVGSGSILMNRLQGNYSQYIPVSILGSSSPEVLAFNVQGGTTIGDLPPYQTFNLGGPNSVRGFEPGAVASGRSFVLASAEYRFPIVSSFGGVLFADYGSDLGSSNTVLGEPGVVRGKPGSGFGYGAGVRLDSPVGLLRADFGVNNQGETRLQFGIGQRF